MRRPKVGEYAEFYQTYIDALPAGSNITAMHKRSFKACVEAFGSVPEMQADFSYAEGKWTVKQLMIHMIDTERIFAFRALVFMRGERVSIPGFIQDDYVANANVTNRTIKDLLAEWKAVHQSNLLLLKQCTPEVEGNIGRASTWPITPRALFYIIVGHRMHHLGVFGERYLSQI